MWKQIERYLPDFASAVLSGLDADGYPYSVRCRPVLEHAQQRLRLTLPATAAVQPGPACLLCHAHDENLWNLKSLVVRGRLEHAAGDWVFVPQHFIPGTGIGGWRSYIRFVQHGSAATRAYFARRGLPIPAVQWDEFMAFLSGQAG